MSIKFITGAKQDLSSKIFIIIDENLMIKDFGLFSKDSKDSKICYIYSKYLYHIDSIDTNINSVPMFFTPCILGEKSNCFQCYIKLLDKTSSLYSKLNENIESISLELKKKYNINHCSFCAKYCYTYKICGRCFNATYCSKECQINDWNKHRGLCKAINQ